MRELYSVDQRFPKLMTPTFLQIIKPMWWGQQEL